MDVDLMVVEEEELVLLLGSLEEELVPLVVKVLLAKTSNAFSRLSPKPLGFLEPMRRSCVVLVVDELVVLRRIFWHSEARKLVSFCSPAMRMSLIGMMRGINIRRVRRSCKPEKSTKARRQFSGMSSVVMITFEGPGT